MAVRRGINPTQGKKKNITYIKEIIYEHSPISRAEIAEMLALTPATITNNVSLLLETGLIREISGNEISEDNGVGRRPIMLEFVANAKCVVGVEISPKGLYFTVCNISGEVLYEMNENRNCLEYENTLNELVSGVETIMKELKLPRGKILGIGVGIPGFVDRRTGFLNNAFWPEWENKNFGQILQERIGLPVCVDNNASVRAIAEGLYDKKRPATFAYLFVSKGIACPLMIQNSVLSREVTGAGEIGHMVIDMNGSKCDRCGDFGCLDTFSSERAICNKCAEAIANGEATILKNIVKDPKNPSIKEVLLALDQKDNTVQQILDIAVKYLAASICNIIKFISPQMVVIDAYIMSRENVKNKFLEYINTHLSENSWNVVEFAFKPFNEYGGAKGGAALAIKNFLIDNDDF